MLIGQKIKEIRIEKGISRPDFCGDEQELTVRQLSRIESGASQPSLPKLDYIARRLGVPAYSLMPDFSALPSAYLELKYQILREPIYGKEEEYDKKEACLEEIGNLFYEQLPSEEKVWFEATRATIDVIRSGRPEYGETVLDDYFKTIYDKELFLINELEVINLYFAIVLTKIKQGQNQIEEINRIHSFLVRLTNHVELIAPEYLFALSNTLFSGLACLDNLSSYDSLEAYIFSLNHIMEKTQDFQKKPIILMLEWKLSLIIKNDYVSAEQFYQKSKLFADIIENSYLVTMLEKQWQEDLKKYL